MLRDERRTDPLLPANRHLHRLPSRTDPPPRQFPASPVPVIQRLDSIIQIRWREQPPQQLLVSRSSAAHAAGFLTSPNRCIEHMPKSGICHRHVHRKSIRTPSKADPRTAIRVGVLSLRDLEVPRLTGATLRPRRPAVALDSSTRTFIAPITRLPPAEHAASRRRQQSRTRQHAKCVLRRPRRHACRDPVGCAREGGRPRKEPAQGRRARRPISRCSALLPTAQASFRLVVAAGSCGGQGPRRECCLGDQGAAVGGVSGTSPPLKQEIAVRRPRLLGSWLSACLPEPVLH